MRKSVKGIFLFFLDFFDFFCFCGKGCFFLQGMVAIFFLQGLEDGFYAALREPQGPGFCVPDGRFCLGMVAGLSPWACHPGLVTLGLTQGLYKGKCQLLQIPNQVRDAGLFWG
jgi:hypothetical protein